MSLGLVQRINKPNKRGSRQISYSTKMVKRVYRYDTVDIATERIQNLSPQPLAKYSLGMYEKNVCVTFILFANLNVTNFHTINSSLTEITYIQIINPHIVSCWFIKQLLH